MATIKYPMTLSTTEPYNYVGKIKVRQADDNTQIFQVTVTENGQPKSFAGLTPFFCLLPGEVTGQGVSEEPVTSYNASAGTLEYTLSPNALQFARVNEAYFSFRKELPNGKWIEQFSTKSFFYTVEKSIYTQPFKDSNYWFTFSELYRKFQMFIEQNREIIESIDPGGMLLSRIGIFNNFREWDYTVIEKMANEFTERGVNVKWFGAKGDGVTDDTEAIQEAVDFVHGQGGGKVRLLDGVYLIDVTPSSQPKVYVKEEASGITLYDNVEFIMTDNAVLKAKKTDSKAYNILRVYNCKNVKISGGNIIGDVDEHADTGGEWGYGIAVSGGENITVENVTITKCWGDGINLQVYQPDLNDYENVIPPKYVYIKSVICVDNRRQGVSIEGGHYVSVSESNFNDTGKTKFTAPGSGIDIEPWRAQARDFFFVENIQIKNCNFLNNKATGVTVMNPVVHDVVIDSCTFIDNMDSEAQIKSYNGANDLLVKNCVIKNTMYEKVKAGIMLSNASNLRANNNQLFNCYLHIRNFNNLESNMKNIYLENNSINIEDKYKVDWIIAVTNAIDNVHIKNNLIEFEGNINSSSVLPTVWISNEGYCNFEKNIISNLGIGITVNNSNVNINENQIINTSQYAIKVNSNLNNISIAQNKISGACRFLREIGAINVTYPESIIITNNVVYRKSIVPLNGELKSTGCRVADISFKSDSSPSVFFSDNTMIEDFTSYNQPVKLTGLETVADRTKVCIFSNNQTGWGNVANLPKTAMIGDLYFDTSGNRLLVCSSLSAYYDNGQERLKAIWRDMNGNIVN